MKPDFLVTMAVGKQNAINRRNRGAGASSHHSWTRKRSDYAPEDDRPESHRDVIVRTHLAWNLARNDAIETFRFACHGDEWLEAFK